MKDESDFCSNEIEFARSLSQHITSNGDDKLISFDDFCKLVQSLWVQNQKSLEAVGANEVDLIDLSEWGELKKVIYIFMKEIIPIASLHCQIRFPKKFKVSIVGGVKYR